MNDFWMSFWKWAGIVASKHPTKAIDESIPIDEFPLWFQDARLNYAENIFSGATDDDLMVTSMDETNIENPERFTWRDMREMTAKYAQAMKSVGIRKGDYMVCMWILFEAHCRLSNLY